LHRVLFRLILSLTDSRRRFKPFANFVSLPGLSSRRSKL
jgi:hypothetical protein